MTGTSHYGTITTLDTLLKVASTISWWLLAIYIIVVFVVAMRQYGTQRAVLRLFSYQVLLPFMIVLGVSLLSLTLVFVLPQEVAVVISLASSGGIRPQPLRAGLHWIIPIFEREAHYPIYWQTYTMASNTNEGAGLGDDSIRARTRDGQEVRLDCSLIFRIDMERAVSIHIDWQDRYIEDLVRPVIRGFVRTQVSQFTVREVNSEARRDLETTLDRLLRDKLAEHGFIVAQFLLRDITFTDVYAAAVEQKQVALEGEAQKIHEAAQHRTVASGRADAIRIEAQAEAEALRNIAQVLEQNRHLLTYRYIEKLSPNIRAMLVPSNTPLILPLSQLRELEGEPAGATAQPTLPPGPMPPKTSPTQP